MQLNLEEEMELLRKKMMDAAIKKGLTAAETINFSRKLDDLMNQYEELKKGLTTK